MSLFKDVQQRAIDNLIQSSLESEYKLAWIPCSQITSIEPTQIDNVYYAIHVYYGIVEIMLLSIGSSEECTPTFVSEFAGIHSLPTHKYNNDVSQFR